MEAFGMEEQKHTQIAPDQHLNKKEERKQMPRRASGQSKSIAILPLYAQPAPEAAPNQKGTASLYSED